MGNAHAHAELLLDGRIGNCRFHTAEVQRLALVLIHIGQHVGHWHGLRRKFDYLANA